MIYIYIFVFRVVVVLKVFNTRADLTRAELKVLRAKAKKIPGTRATDDEKAERSEIVEREKFI